MPTVADTLLTGRSPIGAALATGVDTLSYRQTITFELYVRVVLPIDGYVFWVKSTLVSPSALLNAAQCNTFQANQSSRPQALPPEVPAPRFDALGSFHYITDSRQVDDANYSANRVVFSSEVPLQDMNSIGPNLLYIGTFDGPAPTAQQPVEPRGTTPIRFAFSSRGAFYRQTDLYHYTGYAVYSTMSTQVVDDPASLHPEFAIVSNSLPMWLYFAQVTPPWHVDIPRPNVPFFPSMLATDNEVPPFVTVKIDPANTTSFQMAPALDRFNSGQMLAHDTVTLTLYGCNNSVAQDLFQSILQYSYDSDTTFGILSAMPIPRDEKEGQNELNTIAQKKTIVFEVSYNQTAVRNLARQLIEKALVTVQIGDSPLPPGEIVINP